jgi:hypothetical protein
MGKSIDPLSARWAENTTITECTQEGGNSQSAHVLAQGAWEETKSYSRRIEKILDPCIDT